MMLHGQSVEEFIKRLFFINDLSIYLEEDGELMSVKQMCKEVLYKNIPGMTRFKFIKKDGKKLTNCNKVTKLIQDIVTASMRRRTTMPGVNRKMPTTSTATIVDATTSHPRAEQKMATWVSSYADIPGMTTNGETAPTTHATRI